MANKKIASQKYSKTTGQRTQKTSGVCVLSVRMPVVDNKLLHRAAQHEKRSFNNWASVVLVAAARKTLKSKTKVATEKTLG